MLKNIKTILFGAVLALTASFSSAQSLTWSDTEDGYNGMTNDNKVVVRNGWGSVRLKTTAPNFVPLELYSGNSPALIAVSEKTTGPISQFFGSGSTALQIYKFNWTTYNYDLKFSINYDGSFTFQRPSSTPFTLLPPVLPWESWKTADRIATDTIVGHAVNTMASWEGSVPSTITIEADPMVADRVTTIDLPSSATTLTFSGLFFGARGTVILKQGSSPVSITVPSNSGVWTTKIAVGSGSGITPFINMNANSFTILKWQYGKGEMFVKVDSSYN